MNNFLMEWVIPITLTAAITLAVIALSGLSMPKVNWRRPTEAAGAMSLALGLVSLALLLLTLLWSGPVFPSDVRSAVRGATQEYLEPASTLTVVDETGRARTYPAPHRSGRTVVIEQRPSAAEVRSYGRRDRY